MQRRFKVLFPSRVYRGWNKPSLEINQSCDSSVFDSKIIKAVYAFIQMMNKILTEPTVTKGPVFNFQNLSQIKHVMLNCEPN